MASNGDLDKLAADLLTLPSPSDRVARLLEYIRYELDIAASNREWDSIVGLSQLLGGHAHSLGIAIGVENVKADSKVPRKNSNP